MPDETKGTDPVSPEPSSPAGAPAAPGEGAGSGGARRPPKHPQVLLHQQFRRRARLLPRRKHLRPPSPLNPQSQPPLHDRATSRAPPAAAQARRSCRRQARAQARRPQAGALGVGAGHASAQPIRLRDQRSQHLPRPEVPGRGQLHRLRDPAAHARGRALRLLRRHHRRALSQARGAVRHCLHPVLVPPQRARAGQDADQRRRAPAHRCRTSGRRPTGWSAKSSTCSASSSTGIPT